MRYLKASAILAVSLLVQSRGVASGSQQTDFAQPSHINYAGFVQLAQATEPARDTRLLSWSAFAETAKDGDTLVLDARSHDAFREGHIKGAVNLPLTDFTDASLANAIGRKDRKILIYCNNNFSNNVRPVVLKRREVALNIQTFINLKAYGYDNVFELGETVDFRDPKIGWVRG